MQNQNNEDEIIANSFIMIKNGIESENWDLIIEAYFTLTGEKLSLPEKPKSRLDNIKNLINQKKEKNTRKKKENEVTGKASKVIGSGSMMGINNVLTERKQGDLIIISSEIDQKELENNKKLAPKARDTIRRNTKVNILEKHSNKDSDVRYHNTPSTPPPWS